MESALPVLAVVMVLAGVLLFTPYEAILEGVIADETVTAEIHLLRPWAITMTPG